MKILIITQYFYPETFRINDLVREMHSLGHEVVVLTGVPNYPHGKIYPGYSWRGAVKDDFDGVRVVRVPMLPRGRGAALNLILNYSSFVAGALIFGLPRLRGEKFDACLVFATSPITAAIPANIYRFLSGCPVAIWIQDLWPEVVASVNMVRNPWVIRRIGSLVRWIYRRADLLLIQSESFRNSVLSWGGQLEQIRYLPNWAESFYQARPSSLNSSPFRILFAGNLGRAQGLDVVIEAIEILKKRGSVVEWHFIGDGSRKDWLKQQILERGLDQQAKVFDRRPETEMPAIFARYSALLVSLGKDSLLSLVLPSKVQSSLASAMPVLASGDGELARVIREAECGLVSPAQDADALAENAIRLSKMPAAGLNELGLQGRAYYEKYFARDMLIQRTCQWLSEISIKRRPT